MKNLFLSLIFSFATIGAAAVTNEQAGINYLSYPVPEQGIPTLSPTPDGYTPFHIEHYGRHGSRWRIGPKEYSLAVDYLRKAHDGGILTPRGEELYAQIQTIAKDAQGHLGELTPLGHRQHRGIASRMAANFPEIFTDSTFVDAKSTEVIRCILSMANEVAELQSLFPDMLITMDASQSTQSILNYNPHDTTASKLAEAAKPKATAFRNSLPKPDAFFNNLFTDRQYIAKYIGESELFKAIYDLAISIQGHDNYEPFFDVFSEEEINNEWLARNAEWYVRYGNTPLTKNRTPFSQRVLLRNFIESADTAMLSPNLSANLRFGHDTMLTPLTVLMELDGYGYETTDLSTLADHWKAYEITPMAANIQMIFYRPTSGNYNVDDILVKVLLNEREVSLPVDEVMPGYYPWSSLRSYYLSKISQIP